MNRCLFFKVKDAVHCTVHISHIIDMEQKAIYGYGGYIFIISAPRHVTSHKCRRYFWKHNSSHTLSGRTETGYGEEYGEEFIIITMFSGESGFGLGLGLSQLQFTFLSC